MSESEYLQRAREYRAARDQTNTIARIGFTALAAAAGLGPDTIAAEVAQHLDAFRRALAREGVALDALNRASRTIKEQAQAARVEAR